MHPALFQFFLNALFSWATSLAFLSESNPATGSFTLEINFPLFTITKTDFLKIVLKDHQKALLYGKAAQKLDPLSGIIGINLAKIQISLNEKEDAERTLKNIIKVKKETLRVYEKEMQNKPNR